MKIKSERIIKRYQLEHLVPLGLALISIYFWITYFKSDLFFTIGLITNIIGLIIWWSAKIKLGDNWSAGYSKPKLKKLVTNGIYSKITHPIYWGINITLIGIILITKNILLTIICLTIIVYFFRRMKIEDSFLIKKLGKKYIVYKNKTWLKI
ncbi:MAG: isoprenylcysteine carboxylmethyltransferase family protein [Nanoarchaeota archaeon]